MAVEGVTILQIRQLVSLHVFVGMLLVPFVVLKTGTTGYRFARYYTGDARYTEKGAPPLLLRVTAPLLVVLSLALLGTGIALVALGRTVGHPYLWLHQATFFAWIAILAVHVLGHLEETVHLSTADWRDGRGGAEHRAAGARARLTLVVVTLAVGTVLGLASLSWVGSWHHLAHFGRG